MAGKKGQKKINIAYNLKQAEIVLQGIEDGHTLSSICKKDKSLPPYRVILQWKRQNRHFEQQYRIARESQAEKWLDEMKDLADTPINRNLDKAEKYFEINKRNIRINTTKFLIQKFAPKAFGDKPDVVSLPKAQPIQIINYNPETDLNLLSDTNDSTPSSPTASTEIVPLAAIYEPRTL